MKQLTFQYQDGYYYKVQYKDEYLGMLSYIFDDGSYWVNAVKQELLESNSPGVTGNKTDVTFEGDKIKIEPLYAECPEEYAIQIDRTVLLRLINEWQELTKKRAQEITFTRYEDGTITLSSSEASAAQ